MGYTPTPWKAEGYVIRKDGFAQGKARDNAYIGECDYEESTKRIVECVNTLAGVENPAEFVTKLESDKAKLLEAIKLYLKGEDINDWDTVKLAQEKMEQLITEMEG